MPDFEIEYEYAGPPRIRFESALVPGPTGRPYRHHRLRAGDGGVAIVAQNLDAVLFVRVRRVAADDEIFLELPRGWTDTVDRGSVTAAAVRELQEETGMRPVSAQRVGAYVVDSSIYPAEVAVVHCVTETRLPSGQTDGETEPGTIWVPADDVGDLILRGEVRDAHSLAALAVWHSWCGRREL
ncbi:MAG: hydrolase [Microbacterium sp.]|jgi:8-oxo-dGTP pyrophosphatase MutT (NUDIX family)|nr:hydrolase [Microbacterium sp.]